MVHFIRVLGIGYIAVYWRFCCCWCCLLLLVYLLLLLLMLWLNHEYKAPSSSLLLCQISHSILYFIVHHRFGNDSLSFSLSLCLPIYLVWSLAFIQYSKIKWFLHEIELFILAQDHYYVFLSFCSLASPFFSKGFSFYCVNTKMAAGKKARAKTNVHIAG
jgi:hypothetical protein